MSEVGVRNRITIERRTRVLDASNDQRYKWDFFAKAWAKITPLEGKEVFASAEREGFVPTRFTLRYVKGLAPDMRIRRVFDGAEVIYNIVSVTARDGKRRGWVNVTAIELAGETPTGAP